MQKNKIITCGERYIVSKVRVRINKVKLLKILILFLILAEVVLGVLWALGF